MTKAKAATIAGLLVNANFAVRVVTPIAPAVDWIVRVTSDSPIDVQTVASFATAQTVTGTVTQVDLV